MASNKQRQNTIQALSIGDKPQLVKLADLPPDIQAQIRHHAAAAILVDEAKKEIKADQVDLEKIIPLWLAAKSPRTVRAYEDSLTAWLEWLAASGIHPVKADAEDADRYALQLRDKYRPNGVRLKLSAVSSFYSTLKRYGHVSTNPFYGVAMPRKEFKKAVKIDSEKTIPIMNAAEYAAILAEIKMQSQRVGTTVADANARRAAEKLLPAVEVMAAYGLRVGALPSIQIHDGHFSYTTKGSKTFRREITHTLPPGKKPFASYKIITIQKAFSRVTSKLAASGAIRHPYSAHDLRHFYAANLYAKTKDILVVKNELGHSSLAITDVYLQGIGLAGN